MVGIYDSGPYEDPFAWAGSDLELALLAQQQQQQHHHHHNQHLADQLARSTPEDLTFPTRPVHHPQQHHDFQIPVSPIGGIPKSAAAAVSLPPTDQAYLSLQDFENTTMTDAGGIQPFSGDMDLDLDLDLVEALGIPPFPSSTEPQPSSMTADTLNTQLETARTLISTLQASLSKITRERDQARMQLSTARNELYTARQVEKRLRVERDEAHTERKQLKGQLESLKKERAMGKMNEGRLRKERNEARMALVFKGVEILPHAGARGIRVSHHGGQTGLGAVGLGPGERDMDSMDEVGGSEGVREGVGFFGGTSTEESSPAGGEEGGEQVGAGLVQPDGVKKGS
uniref:Uncharacterized protein n=1 Tax=Podospora anserina (strain S / ATCC MYA-4624 / DSM 980 / FGSC 10383) TaxID=515849 RepID=A0A090CU42_PODAN|nr:Putative protein of unknown function [Podospora anserina S mat+]